MKNCIKKRNLFAHAERWWVFFFGGVAGRGVVGLGFFCGGGGGVKKRKRMNLQRFHLLEF